MNTRKAAHIIMSEDREKRTCMNKYGKKYFLIAAIVALCLFSTAALEITDQYSFEYPGCLLLREIKLWNIRVYYRKYETGLSRYISRNRIRVDSLRQNNYMVSARTWTLYGLGLERKTGGVGNDLLKLNVLISHKSQTNKEDFYSLLESLSSDPAKFQKKVWKLVYEIDL